MKKQRDKVYINKNFAERNWTQTVFYDMIKKNQRKKGGSCGS
jgi:hypothetical protein